MLKANLQGYLKKEFDIVQDFSKNGYRNWYVYNKKKAINQDNEMAKGSFFYLLHIREN